MTAFVHTTVEVAPGAILHVDGNSKVTASGGTYAAPIPNAFSLPHISTCPGSTPACREACYVHGLEANARETYRLYSLNAAAVHRILMSPRTAYRAAEAFGEWIAHNTNEFRWHVSGDVFSQRYAGWLVDVQEAIVSARPECLRPHVSWIYTRSFEQVGILAQAPGLVINLSADADNYIDARACAERWGVRVCYLTRDGLLPTDLRPHDVVFPDYPLRGRDLVECRGTYGNNGCGWRGVCKELYRDPQWRPGDYTCPVCHGGHIVGIATAAPWWQGLVPAQRRLVCPPDFFGQSQHLRCGPCRKCMRPVGDAPLARGTSVGHGGES